MASYCPCWEVSRWTARGMPLTPDTDRAPTVLQAVPGTQASNHPKSRFLFSLRRVVWVAFFFFFFAATANLLF